MSDHSNPNGARTNEEHAVATLRNGAEVGSPETPPTDDALLDAEALENKIVDVLRTIFDPEIPVDIYELGLVYRVRIEKDNDVVIDMTLTSPACPVAGSLPAEVQYKVASIKEVNDVSINLVWDPPWTPELMSEAAKLELNMW